MSDISEKTADELMMPERIRRHPLYTENYEKLQELEKTRIFCGHSIEHFLSVARLMMIYNAENGTGLSKELIYAAALLHDIGRAEQYENGTPHDIAGALIAEKIMRDCGFDEADIKAVREAILGHRDKNADGKNDLCGLLNRADKKSRLCFECPAEKECSWPEGKKNMRVEL